MRIFTLAFVFQAGFSISCTLAALAVNSPRPPSQCRNPLARREWRALSDTQRSKYIRAVKCLMTLPSSGVTGKGHIARTRFDEFNAMHIVLADETHLVGQFLPYHRMLLHLYEKALREECGYTGAQPYWNWSLDVVDGMKSWSVSPIWDPKTGFGGNGKYIPNYLGPFGNWSDFPEWVIGANTGGGCIETGPFVGYNLSLGPGPILDQSHCITRAWTPTYFPKLTAEAVEDVKKKSPFEVFRFELEGVLTPTMRTHDGGHVSVGGEMNNLYSSNGDPVFYLHHTYLDKIWWDWQKDDLKARLTDISGRSSVNPPFTNITLNTMLKADGMGPEIPIEQVMDIRNDYLCYNYV